MSKIIDKHKIIAVDCDDVLSDTTQYLLDYFNLKNTLGDKITVQDIKDYRYCNNKNFGYTNEEFVEMFIEMYENDDERFKIPPIDGAYEVLKDLKNQGKELHVVTARQSFFENYTKKWIEKYYPEIFDSVHFCNHDGGGEYLSKADVCKKLGATLLIDDTIENGLTAAESGIDVVLFNKPWNDHTDIPYNNVHRVSKWVEIIKD